MKFLRNLVYLGLLVSLMSMTIRGARKTMVAAPLQAECDGLIFTDNERIGSYGSDAIYTRIINGRIYIQHGTKLQNNLDVLFGVNANFPNDGPATKARIKKCINQPDPSTNGSNALVTVPGGVTCNGKFISHHMLLSTFYGGDGVYTRTYAYVDNGLLLAFAWRGNDFSGPMPNPLAPGGGFYSGLIVESMANPPCNGCTNNAGFVLNQTDLENCFYYSIPVYPDRLLNTPCASAPTIQSISSISQTALSFAFGGSGMTSLTWRIKPSVPNPSNERSGVLSTLTGTTASLSFTGLPTGEYRLEIEGGDCDSTPSTMLFTIPRGNCASVPTITSISSISVNSINVAFSGGNNPNTLAWKILNSSSNAVALGRAELATGATSAVLTYPALSPGSYTLQIEGGDCVSTPSLQTFVVPVGDSRGTCSLGPTITSIPQTSVTSSGLTFVFNGNDVYSLAWKILDAAGTSTVANSTTDVAPQSNTISIPYSLADGNYRLEIQGGATCKSTPNVMNFYIGAAPLPIRVTNFRAETKKEGVNLSWQVVTEENGEKFQITRFTEQERTPEVIGEVYLRDQPIGNYSFLDGTASAGINYYQLKQVDKDGTFEYSRIVAVNREKVNAVILAPNPAKEYVDVDFESKENGTALFDTYNLSGIRVMQTSHKVKIGSNKIRVDISGLSDGSYILKVQDQVQGTGLRFVKLR